MPCSIIAFVILFVLPIGVIITLLRPAAQLHVATMSGLATLAFIAALLLPKLWRRVRARRVRLPVARTLAALDWPASLTRAELEAHCAAWLRGRGWDVTLTTHPDPEAEGVYLMATRAATTVAVMCDQRGEDLNPAIIRAFAKESALLGATQAVLLTLVPGKLPYPAETAARQAGVRLLRAADLPQLDTLGPAPAPDTAEPAALDR
jgi:hypothetical protein